MLFLLCFVSLFKVAENFVNMYVINKKFCDPSVQTFTEKYLVKHSLHTCRFPEERDKNFS